MHDTRQVTVDVQKHGRKGFLGFGGSVKKSYHFSSASSFSRGSENAGRFFTAMTERFKATNPSFTAVRSDINASTSVEILAGVNHHQSVEQASSSGPIWQKVDVTAEKHKIHVNPHFGGAVHIHSPSVIVERVNGSGLFPNLHSDSQVQYRSVTDEHERTSKSQKSLTAGAALIVKLAATLAMTTLTGNPLAAEGLMGTIASAGLNTLCSDAAVCLVQNDGDPARAMEAMGERNIGKSMFTSMAMAGLIGGGPLTEGLSSGELITAYAKHEMIKAAVNATLAATIDGQDLGQAILQGIITASISTAATFGAHKIGDLHKPRDGSKGISGAAHKSLHTANGAAIGALTAAIIGDDIAKGAASGGFGALVGTLMTEAMVDDKTPAATAQRITQMSDLITTTLALAAGLDPVSAYAASRNANEHNALQHLDTLKELGIVKEGEEVYEGDEPEKTEGQKQYEKGLRKYVKDEVERVRQIRRTALTQDDYEHIEKQATKYYAQAYWAQQAPGLTVEYGLTATSLCTGGFTGAVLGAADTAYGIVTGKTKAPTTTAELFDTATSMLPGTKLTTLLKGASKFDRAVTHLSSSSTAKQMPVCMTKSQNPHADVFKRVARDDWGVSTRVKLFGTDEVHLFKGDRVRKVGTRMPINAEYAGRVFKFDEQWLAKKLDGVSDPIKIAEIKKLPQKYAHGVPFTGAGKADFTRYAQAKVEIPFSGNSKLDIRAANRVMGWQETPKDMTWHHHHDSKTMMLIDKILHEEVRHTGGSAMARVQQVGTK